MRVCILISSNNRDGGPLREIASCISSTLNEKGYDCSVFNTSIDTDKKITIFDYIVVISEPVSLFSKQVPSSLEKYLSNCGTISGKRGATVLYKGLRKSSCMATLMKKVESEGVILKTSEFISNTNQAKAFAKSLNCERNN